MRRPLEQNNRMHRLLPLGVAHIWIAELKRSSDEIGIFNKILGSDEFHKVRRFHFQQDQLFYIARHGILKKLLSFYTELNPDQIKYSFSEFGKPFLSDSLNRYGIEFNLSHSNSMGIFAFTRSRKIGVDIEYKKSKPGIYEIVDQHFTEDEKLHFNRTQDQEKLDLFYKYWTRKEAAVKAIGIGLQCPLDKVSVALNSHEIKVDYDVPFLNKPASWSLYELNVPPCYEGTLAAEGKIDAIHYYNWD